MKLKKLPKLNKKNFNYSFYLVYWIDINSTCTWENLKTIDNYLPTTCITTGWLVSTKNNCHKFVSDISFEDNGTVIEVGNTTTIPNQNIIKMKKVKLW